MAADGAGSRGGRRRRPAPPTREHAPRAASIKGTTRGALRWPVRWRRRAAAPTHARAARVLLALRPLSGWPGRRPVSRRPIALAEKACALGEGLGCNDFGASVAAKGAASSAAIAGPRGVATWLHARRRDVVHESWEPLPGRERHRARHPQSIRALTRGCDLEEAQASSSAGGIFGEGDGTLKGGKKDPNKARTFLEKGCRLGSSYACSKVRPEAVNVSASRERSEPGGRVQRGARRRVRQPRPAISGGSRSREEPGASRGALREACALGFPPSCEQLGALELAGRHALRKARAADYFKRACDRSWPAGCERLVSCCGPITGAGPRRRCSCLGAGLHGRPPQVVPAPGRRPRTREAHRARQTQGPGAHLCACELGLKKACRSARRGVSRTGGLFVAAESRLVHVAE